MTIEQIQKLSKLTEIASQTNDIESLQKIFDILKKDKNENGSNEEGFEWFFALINSQQADLLN